MTITLPVPPSANRWWRSVGNRVLLSREAREYQAATKIRAFDQGVRVIHPPKKVAVSVTWYRGRQSGDLDKRLGVLLDGLQGIAYASDAQIVELHAWRKDDKRNPRVEVTITEAA